jgi:SPP1 gp7 family putative phage head morphogenesis protein
LSPPQASKKLRKQIDAAIDIGRQQVSKELGGTKALETKDKKESRAARIVDSLLSRIINEIQTRAINLFTSWATVDMEEEQITARIENDLDEQSLKVFEGYAQQAANAAINAGRDAEMLEQEDGIERYEWSSILDKNTCSSCEELDGKTAQNRDELPDAPLSECEGGAQCRCFIVAVGSEGNA